MTSRNWPARSVLVCGISLLACGICAAQPAAKTPAIALVDAGDAPQWQTWTKGLGWPVIAPAVAASANPDARVQALAAAVEAAIHDSNVDPARVYLAGRGDASAVILYTISRVPDLWAAAVALGGSPQPAIDTNRIYSANFSLVPVLWVSDGPADQSLAEKLKSAGLNLEWHAATAGVSGSAVFGWLADHVRDDFPAAVDCETNSPAFARCYWIRMTKFDAGERNDVLPLSLLPAASGAALELGPFSYKPDDPGPGLSVVLPQKYSGPLKAGDRLLELEGRAIENGRQYADMLAKMVEERPVTLLVQRGKDRIRVETHVLLPRRDPVVTARVQGKYLYEDKQILIVSRTATELKVTVPAMWVPGSLNWNGLIVEDLKAPGCYLLKVEKELLHAASCQ